MRAAFRFTGHIRVKPNRDRMACVLCILYVVCALLRLGLLGREYVCCLRAGGGRIIVLY